MHWRLSKHARVELIRRAIPLSLLEDTIVVDDTIEPMVVVTAYQTSKVDKYWREDEDLLRS